MAESCDVDNAAATVSELMGELVSLIFFIAVAFNAYHAAKRQGRWSWPQFFAVMGSLIAGPVLILWLLKDVVWLQDKPGVFTLVAITLILLFVCALAYALKKFWPVRNKPAS